MEYRAFQALTVEEQAKIADAELPVVPVEMLRNAVTRSRAMRQNGVMGWEITQGLTGGSETAWYPTVRTKEVSGVTVRYLFNPLSALYEPMMEESEPSVEEEPIGGYGMAWMRFMEEQHPDLVDMMMFAYAEEEYCQAVYMDKRRRTRCAAFAESENSGRHNP